MQAGLVAFEAQHVVTALRVDGSGDRGLAAHGINRHDAAGQREQLQEFGDGRDFVRFRVRLDLAEAQALHRRPRADHMNGGLVGCRVKGPSQRLALDGNHVPRQQLGQRLDPREKRRLERVRVRPGEDTAKCVV